MPTEVIVPVVLPMVKIADAVVDHVPLGVASVAVPVPPVLHIALVPPMAATLFVITVTA